MPKDVPVKAVRTALRIIEALVELDGAGVHELAEHLDIPKSTVHDHLQTLRTERYAINDDGTYRISTRFLELGERSRKQRRVYQTAAEEMQKLARETGEHVLLMIEERGLGVILAISEGEQAVQIDAHPGLPVRLHTTAMGKCILAHLPEEKKEWILDHYGLPAVTEQTTTDVAELESELEDIREQGYGIDSSGEVEGVRCVGAPIFQNNEIVASLGLSGPEHRIKEEYAEEMREKLLQTTNVIEVALNYA